MVRLLFHWVVLLGLIHSVPGGADTPPFQVDPLTIQREDAGYRYPQAGWIVLHIEGEPHQRGFQHGKLLAQEIAAHLRCFAAVRSPKAPEVGWKHTRTLVNALFLRRFHPEFLEEMRGIAEGAAAGGAKFDKRPLDLLDIVALNCWAEIETLDAALEALPAGQERPPAAPSPKPMHCSAFAATAPATADGKIVFGHITMFDLYPANFYNVWLDIMPARGHRVLMQTYPGGIQSGMDYYVNNAGLMICETTIDQTRFDGTGLALASRIRQAVQYSDSIDQVVATLIKENNGLYTNEWLLADTKTNEIAMFELGTQKSKLWRSSKNQWFGNTPGFYWGCNSTKDLGVRLETIPGVEGRPENLVWRPSARDQAWQQLYRDHRGRIDAAFARKAFTTPPVASYHALDVKFTTSDLMKDLKSWALFGPPLGRSWQPTHEERQQYAEIRPLVSNPWTMLGPPVLLPKEEPPHRAVDLHDQLQDAGKVEEDPETLPQPLWQGTLLPKSGADIWLAAAFAEYERVLAREVALLGHNKSGENTGRPTPEQRDKLAVELFASRSSYLAAARAAGDIPLSKIRPDPSGDTWYRIAAGKGVLLLHELRRLVGNPLFEETMAAFGQAHAGKEVTTAEFRNHFEKAAPHVLLDPFFDSWLNEPGLPMLSLNGVAVRMGNRIDVVYGEVRGKGPRLGGMAYVTLEGATGAENSEASFRLDGMPPAFEVEVLHKPRRIVVDKFGELARGNGGIYSVRSYQAELAQTLLIYGTTDEGHANREAAAALQAALRESGSNLTVPIKADSEVTDIELKSRHLLVIGRPESNALLHRFRAQLPLAFGRRSFVVRDEAYAHPASAVFAAADNPVNPRFSLVLLAGLSAEATVRAAPQLVTGSHKAGEIVILPHGLPPRVHLLPARDLVFELAP